MAKNNNGENIETIITELEQLKESMAASVEATAEALVELDETVTTKQAARAAAIQSGDADAVATIDGELQTLSIQREILMATIERGEHMAPADVQAYLARVAAVVDAGDAAANSTFTTLKAQAKTASDTVVNLRKRAVDAIYLLVEMCPQSMAKECEYPGWRFDATRTSGITEMSQVENMQATGNIRII